MATLSREDISNFCDRYIKLCDTTGAEPAEDNPDLLILEKEWRQRAPRSKSLRQVVHKPRKLRTRWVIGQALCFLTVTHASAIRFKKSDGSSDLFEFDKAFGF